MPSERVQRRIDRLLDQAEEAAEAHDWDRVLDCVRAVLDADPANEDALVFKGMADAVASGSAPQLERSHDVQKPSVSYTSDQPSSFASGRYTVSKFLGEGGKKKVYFAHDNTLDRDVAFALIKTEGLDETSRERVRREAQAMGRMGTHPSIMPIYDLGEEVVGTSTQPYMVQPVMVGGDVEGLVEEADGPLELNRALEIATQTAQGLSFAHGKGIVHRDLKPGNVWLDEDGAAKIGDFGLAVATDRSRLTVEKVIVGTVSYMPPEQATGGEVTPRADLYSLGAMLYEMCTGRVPFMGDDDIGIISQHINTPPVAPSWHNNQIPKTLDSLILRLLAKDPAERPSDAGEVLAALEAVDLTAIEEREDENKGSLDSMAGGVFVGRHREMDQLKSIFEDVLSGRGRMVTLVGEPGIGKTRTAQELATYASMRGAQVLWGRSYESGGAPPYWPWVQAIRSHVAATEPQALRDQMGSTAPVIADVVSDVTTKLPDLPAPTPIGDPESARFRLFDSISTFLKNIAASTPLVVMLEDLHWSDKPSLMLLEFVARELANSRILIVGNYRDMELNRRHPLSVTLGDLSRERLFERVLLRGLQKHDVHRFIEIAAGITAPSALVDTVHSQTEGNPLFVTETVRLLIQEGDITSGQSSKGGTTSWEIRIPEGVREVIGRRLDRLSERCNEVLTIAAVIGRQFQFNVLSMLVEDTTDNQLLDAMDEALAARIVEELPDAVGFYQFTHAQMQETLTKELSHTRAVRTHAQIAETLEKYYGDDAEEHAGELAEHFAEAETVLGIDKVIDYSILSGEQSLSAFAFDLARENFARAISLIPDISTDPRYAVGHRGLGTARLALLESYKGVLNLVAAFDWYLKEGRIDETIRTAQVPMPTLAGIGDMLPALEMVNSGLSLVRNDGTAQSRLLANKGCIEAIHLGDLTRGTKSIASALKIAEADGDSDLEMRLRSLAGLITVYHTLFSIDSSQAQIESERAIALATAVSDPLGELMAVYVKCFSGVVRLSEYQSIEKVARQALPLAERLGDRHQLGRILFMIDMACIGQGHWDAAAEAGGRAIDLGIVDGYSLPLSSRLSALSYVGDTVSASFLQNRLRELVKMAPDGPALARLVYGLGAVLIAEITQDDSELGFAAEHIDAVLDSSYATEAIRVFAQTGQAMIALRQNKRDKYSELYKRILPNQGTLPIVIATDRLLGRLAGELHEMDDAKVHFSDAITRTRRAGHLPELAWTCADYAALLLESNAPGDREQAIELQDEAIAIASELGMKPLLERVLAKREILKA